MVLVQLWRLPEKVARIRYSPSKSCPAYIMFLHPLLAFYSHHKDIPDRDKYTTMRHIILIGCILLKICLSLYRNVVHASSMGLKWRKSENLSSSPLQNPLRSSPLIFVDRYWGFWSKSNMWSWYHTVFRNWHGWSLQTRAFQCKLGENIYHELGIYIWNIFIHIDGEWFQICEQIFNKDLFISEYKSSCQELIINREKGRLEVPTTPWLQDSVIRYNTIEIRIRISSDLRTLTLAWRTARQEPFSSSELCKESCHTVQYFVV